MIYVRHNLGEVFSPRRFGPVEEDRFVQVTDNMILPVFCPACRWPFLKGQYTTIVPLGPGVDEEEQEKAREGRWYNARAIEVHWSCATGKVDDEE
jgi:hypothetical protein